MGSFPEKIDPFFGSISLLFSMKVAGAHAHNSRGKSPTPAS